MDAILNAALGRALARIDGLTSAPSASPPPSSPSPHPERNTMLTYFNKARFATLISVAAGALAGAYVPPAIASQARRAAPKKHDPEAVAKAEAKRQRRQARNLRNGL